LRLNCALYAQQVENDMISRGESMADKRDRIDKWEDEASRRQQARRDKIQADQQKLERASRPPQQLSERHSSKYMPQGFYSAASSRATSSNRRDEDDIDDDQV